MAKALPSAITILFVSVLTILAFIILSESATTQAPRTVRKTVLRRRKNSSATTATPLLVSTIPTPIEVTTLRDELTLVETTAATTQLLAPSTTSPRTLEASAVQENVQPHFRNRNLTINPTNSTIITCDVHCDPNTCVRPRDCHTEMVLDHCSCCYVCAALEGDVCYNDNLNMPFYAGMGICGSSLSCLLKNDVQSNERITEAYCHCRDTKVICGSDNVTYTSECKLREAAHFNPSLIVQAWNPCLTAPWIADIDNMTAAAGEEMSLSCEVRAYPWPVIHWQFLEESSSLLYTLPGDDPTVVVTIRGGPEQMMTSSWLQIISVSPRRQGVYFCIAINSEGTARKQIYVSVYNNNNNNNYQNNNGDNGGRRTVDGGQQKNQNTRNMSASS